MGHTNPSGNPYTGQLSSLAQTQTGYGTDVSNIGLGQVQAGASGQLTPADQALVQSTTDQMNLGTSGRYGNLGLGGSTMEQQDLNANALRALAEESNLAKAEEKIGLDAMTEGRGFFSGAGQDLSAAGTEYQQGYNSLINTIAGLGNKSAGGGSGASSGVPGILQRIFGGGGGGGGGAGTSTSDVADFWNTPAGVGGTTSAGDVADWWQTAAGAGGDGTSVADVASFWENVA